MYSKFGLLTYEISQLIRQRFNKEAEIPGFTHSQWRVLVHLSENENCRQVDLAEILEIKPITLVKQIDLLEKAGLVRRNKDKEDRRAYRLQITPKAQSVIQELWKIADSVEDQALSVLTEEQQASLVKLLHRIKRNMTEKVHS
jgi:DNA-binding MarR family transcriptional regulator